MFGMIDVRRWLLLVLTLPVWALALLLVAVRSDNVGTDTANYREYFNLYASSEWRSNLEIGFDILLRAVASVTDRPEVFFGVVFIVVAIFLMRTVSLATAEVVERHKLFLPVLFAGLLLASSWFNVATLNGLRQGMSLSVLYYAVHLICRDKKALGGIFILLALSFHDSTIFAVGSLALLTLSARWVFAIFYVSASLYAAGIYERLVSIFSRLTGVGLYDAIETYAKGVNLWRGFQMDLFAYTIFWPTLYILASFAIRQDYRPYVYRSISIYCALCMPYFILGFGSFSNRFALMAWLYLPVLHVVFLLSARLTAPAVAFISSVFFAIGLVRYFGLFIGDVFF